MMEVPAEEPQTLVILMAAEPISGAGPGPVK